MNNVTGNSPVLKNILWILAPLFLVAGCQWLPPASYPKMLDKECDRFSLQLGNAINRHTHFDPALPPQHHQWPFYLYHRKDRFLAGFDAKTFSPQQLSGWYAETRVLGTRTLKTEAGRLPVSVQQQLANGFSGVTGKTPPELETVIDTCSAQYEKLLSENTPAEDFPAMNYQIPDGYSSAQRVFGAYPLLSWLAQGSIDDYRQMMSEKVQQGPQQVFAQSAVYQSGAAAEETTEIPLSFESIETWLKAGTDLHPLKLPALTDQQLQTLFQAYAPTLMVEQQSSADLLGKVTMEPDNGDSLPVIATQHPVIYWYPTFTRLNQKILLQLNYGFWFPERPPQNGFDIYAGPLDGLLWRVTLDEQGKPLVYDSIHQCGCYHKVYLPAGITADLSQLKDEKPLLFDTGFQVQKPKGVVLKIESATHYLVDVSASLTEATKGQGQATNNHYQLQPYDSLLTLNANQVNQSLFGASGIIDHSARAERFILWPLGVPSAGAMRQRGLHAIAFIGRRHFDEPFLWEQLQVKRQQ